MAFILILIALGAAAGLGFQVGFRRGIVLGVERAEEDMIVTTITRIVEDKSYSKEHIH